MLPAPISARSVDLARAVTTDDASTSPAPASRSSRPQAAHERSRMSSGGRSLRFQRVDHSACRIRCPRAAGPSVATPFTRRRRPGAECVSGRPRKTSEILTSFVVADRARSPAIDFSQSVQPSSARGCAVGSSSGCPSPSRHQRHRDDSLRRWWLVCLCTHRVHRCCWPDPQRNAVAASATPWCVGSRTVGINRLAASRSKPAVRVKTSADHGLVAHEEDRRAGVASAAHLRVSGRLRETYRGRARCRRWTSLERQRPKRYDVVSPGRLAEIHPNRRCATPVRRAAVRHGFGNASSTTRYHR